MSVINSEIEGAVAWHALLSLQRRHNEPDGVSDHQSHDCLLNRLLGRDQRKHQSSVSMAFVRGIDRWLPRTKGQ